VEEISLNVTLPTDHEGMIGRECPQCEKYFKVKPGTGLTDITTCTCPYCERTDDSREFLTKAQHEYIRSIAVREVLGPSLRDLERAFRDLERATRHSLISLRVKTRGFDLPVEYYTEEDLETIVTCDSCGLVFAIYGVFAACPDCARLTAMSMFKKSLQAARRRLSILPRIPLQESDLRQALVIDTLSAAVATFDSLGKRLQKEFPAVFPDKPRNLFQNLNALSDALQKNASVDLIGLVGAAEYSKVCYLFQVRHIWIHNFGEADDGFIRKTNQDQSLIGTKIVPSEQEVEEFLNLIELLGGNLRGKIQGCT